MKPFHQPGAQSLSPKFPTTVFPKSPLFLNKTPKPKPFHTLSRNHKPTNSNKPIVWRGVSNEIQAIVSALERLRQREDRHGMPCMIEVLRQFVPKVVSCIRKSNELVVVQRVEVSETLPLPWRISVKFPRSVEHFRFGSSKVVGGHTASQREQMLNKASELGVTIPSTSGPKPTKSAMADFLSKPLATDFMTSKSPLMVMSGETRN